MWKPVLKLAAAPLLLMTMPAAATAAGPASPMLMLGAQVGDAEAAKAEAAIMAQFAKLFDIADKTPIDPAQLALGQVTAARLLPQGAYGNVIDQVMGAILGPMLALAPGMEANEIAELTGVDFDAAAALTEDQRKSVEAIVDPGRKTRTDGAVSIMRPLLIEVGTSLEPPIREGIARAYARRFTAAQLAEMNAFFATPTGSAYAAESFAMQYNPEVMAATMQAMPVMMTKIMSGAADMEAKMNALPKQRKIAELGAAELTALAALVGTTAESIKAHADAAALMEPTDMADGADRFPAADNSQPWFDRDNWSAQDRAAVDAINARSEAVIGELIKAEDGAVARAKARLAKAPKN